MTETSRRVARTASPETLCCSFCGKSQLDIQKLVAGPGVYICNECIDLCKQIVDQELRSSRPAKARKTKSRVPPMLKAWEGLTDDELSAEMTRAHAAHQNVDRAVGLHVAALRSRRVTWARVGEALGMTRQSAWERFSGEE